MEAHVMMKPRHHCFCLAARLYLEINTGAPRGLGKLVRRAIYFQGAGLHWYYFRDLRSKLIVLGILGALQKSKK